MTRLDAPKIQYMPSYIEALREGYVAGNDKPKTEEEIRQIELDPQAFLNDFLAIRTDPVILPNGQAVERVPATDFWYVDGSEFIGRISIRHHLNEFLLITGGNIGYGVRPSRQGHGHATAMLKAALPFCRGTLGLGKVLITVDDDNLASIRVIEKNGGVLEDKRKRVYDDVIVRRYWITL